MTTPPTGPHGQPEPGPARAGDLRKRLALLLANRRWAGPDGAFDSWADVGSRGQRVVLADADAVLEALAEAAEADDGQPIVHAIYDTTNDPAYVEGVVDGHMIAAWLRGIGETGGHAP